MINFFHGDCMYFMRGKPDGYYDLAVVDPPYGDGGGIYVQQRQVEVRPAVREVRPRKACGVNHMFGGRSTRYNISTPPIESTGYTDEQRCKEESVQDGRHMGDEVQAKPEYKRGCL